MTFRFVLSSILVQIKFTTDRYVVYKWLSCKFSPSPKGEGLFSCFGREDGTNEENRILYHKGQILYIRALNSSDETIRIRAADLLVGFYMRKRQYDKAEKYLEYFSVQNPERKRKQAQIYAETGRIREAYKAYEELLFSDFQRSSMELHGMYMLALQDNNRKKARWLADKQKELARCFEMGKYYEISSELEIATIEKDADSVITVMEEMLSSAEQIGDFRKSILYEHLDFKEVKEDFISNLKENLKKCFQDEENYGFLRDNKRWQKLVNQ